MKNKQTTVRLMQDESTEYSTQGSFNTENGQLNVEYDTIRLNVDSAKKLRDGLDAFIEQSTLPPARHEGGPGYIIQRTGNEYLLFVLSDMSEASITHVLSTYQILRPVKYKPGVFEVAPVRTEIR